MINTKLLEKYKIDEKSAVPKYDQLRKIMLDYITNLPEDVEYLPYEYEIESQMHVSKRTIRRAFDELRNEGIIETLRKRGSKIVRRNFATPQAPTNGDLLKCQLIASILVSDTDDPHPTNFLPWQITSGLEDHMRPKDSSVEVYNLREKKWHDREKLKESLALSGIEWAFVYPHDKVEPEEIKKILTELNIKTAFYIEDLKDMSKLAYLLEDVDYVAVNHLLGIYRELQNNFSDIDYLLFAGSDQDLFWEQPRIDICKKFAKNLNIPFELVIKEAPVIDINHTNNQELNVRGKEIGLDCAPDIVSKTSKYQNALCFAANDRMAAGVIDYCHDNNIAIPEQFSLISYDNKPDYRSYNLSTFDFDAKSISDELIDLYKNFLEDKETARNKSFGRMIYPKLIMRSTTR